VMSLSDTAIRVIQASQNELGSSPPSSIFERIYEGLG